MLVPVLAIRVGDTAGDALFLLWLWECGGVVQKSVGTKGIAVGSSDGGVVVVVVVGSLTMSTLAVTFL